MMLDHLGEPTAANSNIEAIEHTLADTHLRTRHLGGSAGTVECTKAVAEAIA